jgi:hypothetical protein
MRSLRANFRIRAAQVALELQILSVNAARVDDVLRRATKHAKHKIPLHVLRVILPQPSALLGAAAKFSVTSLPQGLARLPTK